MRVFLTHSRSLFFFLSYLNSLYTAWREWIERKRRRRSKKKKVMTFFSQFTSVFVYSYAMWERRFEIDFLHKFLVTWNLSYCMQFSRIFSKMQIFFQILKCVSHTQQRENFFFQLIRWWWWWWWYTLSQSQSRTVKTIFPFYF
jgi:glucan phosphoethanolaminetransferase (alkaline phosphatase superfamily)